MVAPLLTFIRFGASLSYASPDGRSAAAAAQTLGNQMIEDDVEIIVLSNKTCEGGSCGYTRPGGVAYREFTLHHSSQYLLVYSDVCLRKRTALLPLFNPQWLASSSTLLMISQMASGATANCS